MSKKSGPTPRAAAASGTSGRRGGSGPSSFFISVAPPDHSSLLGLPGPAMNPGSQRRTGLIGGGTCLRIPVSPLIRGSIRRHPSTSAFQCGFWPLFYPSTSESCRRFRSAVFGSTEPLSTLVTPWNLRREIALPGVLELLPQVALLGVLVGESNGAAPDPEGPRMEASVRGEMGLSFLKSPQGASSISMQLVRGAPVGVIRSAPPKTSRQSAKQPNTEGVFVGFLVAREPLSSALAGARANPHQQRLQSPAAAPICPSRGLRVRRASSGSACFNSSMRDSSAAASLSITSPARRRLRSLNRSTFSERERRFSRIGIERSSTVSGSFPIPAIAFGPKTSKSLTSWLLPTQVV